jgi:hypothetical protein
LSQRELVARVVACSFHPTPEYRLHVARELRAAPQALLAERRVATAVGGLRGDRDERVREAAAEIPLAGGAPTWGGRALWRLRQGVSRHGLPARLKTGLARAVRRARSALT